MNDALGKRLVAFTKQVSLQEYIITPYDAEKLGRCERDHNGRIQYERKNKGAIGKKAVYEPKYIHPPAIDRLSMVRPEEKKMLKEAFKFEEIEELKQVTVEPKDVIQGSPGSSEHPCPFCKAETIHDCYEYDSREERKEDIPPEVQQAIDERLGLTFKAAIDNLEKIEKQSSKKLKKKIDLYRRTKQIVSRRRKILPANERQRKNAYIKADEAMNKPIIFDPESYVGEETSTMWGKVNNELEIWPSDFLFMGKTSFTFFSEDKKEVVSTAILKELNEDKHLDLRVALRKEFGPLAEQILLESKLRKW